MSLANSIDHNLVPNLPGYRSKPIKPGPKKSVFTLVGGQVFLKDEYRPSSPGGEDETSIASIASSTFNKSKKFFDETRVGVILNFHAFFEEAVEGQYQKQVRYCNIFFYSEEGSLKVVEKPQVNSGVSQGTLVKKAVINKADGTPITEGDFQIGSYTKIYGRFFKIYDADPFTKKYMQKNYGWSNSQGVEAPVDPYSTYRKSMEAGPADTWDKFRSKKNETKNFTEARLGHSVNNKGREGFNKYGNTSLRFRCVWDDTSQLYGDVIEFSLTYYLSDDTLEIISIPSALTKDSTSVRLLKKTKLPKNFHDVMQLGARPATATYFYWSDFYIGMELEVFGRNLRLIDADNATRRFYEEQQMPLSAPILPPPAEIIVHEREVPPPTGFGSEEDSLRSVAGSLMPGPPPMKKLGENKVLSFLASLLSGGVDDVDRRFVITYYVQDNTLKIIEPPVRNSGFVGGEFLSRRSVKHPTGETINERDLYLGRKLKILKHEFLLIESSDSTLRWMEDKGFPRSNFYVILDKIRPTLYRPAQTNELYNDFVQYETSRGQATKDTLKLVLSKYNLIGDGPKDISEHELVTILRANGNKASTFNYEKLIEQIINPTDEYK